MDKHRTENALPLVGAWKLVAFTVRKSDGNVTYPFGDDAQGTIMYTASGRFSVQLRRTDRPRFASGDQMQGTREEIEAGYEGYIAYYGSYEFDPTGGFVVHHVDGSLFPNWEGQGLKRYCAFSGLRLTLTTPPIVWGGESVGTLVWERIG